MLNTCFFSFSFFRALRRAKIISLHVHWLMSLVHQAQILNGDAGLLQGSRSSVVRASTAKVGGLGFDSQWLPKFFPSVCFYSDLPPVAYQQFLLPVVVIRIVTKLIMCLPMLGDRCLGGLITPTFPFIIG